MARASYELRDPTHRIEAVAGAAGAGALILCSASWALTIISALVVDVGGGAANVIVLGFVVGLITGFIVFVISMVLSPFAWIVAHLLGARSPLSALGVGAFIGACVGGVLTALMGGGALVAVLFLGLPAILSGAVAGLVCQRLGYRRIASNDEEHLS